MRPLYATVGSDNNEHYWLCMVWAVGYISCSDRLVYLGLISDEAMHISLVIFLGWSWAVLYWVWGDDFNSKCQVGL